MLTIRRSSVGHALLLVLAILLVPAPVSAMGAPDDLADAEAAFAAAVQNKGLAERQAALERLVALGNPGAVPLLVTEYARASKRLRAARDEAFRTRYVLERRRILLESMKLRMQRDESLKASVAKQVEQIEEIAATLETAEGKITEGEPWCASLGAKSLELFESISVGKRKKAEKGIWKDAEEHPKLEIRLASVEMLGKVGSPGTALTLQKMLNSILSERAKLKRKLPKLEVDVRKEEARLQAEQKLLEGKITNAAMAQYNRVKKEASQARKQLTLLSHLTDQIVVAGGEALGREEGKLLEKTLQAFVRILKKARGGVRLRTLQMLGRAPNQEVRDALREMLDVEKEPAARARLINDLALLGDDEVVPSLIDRFLIEENWHVRSNAAAALATLRVKEAIPALIARLEVEEGRLLTDVRNALSSLTGQDFRLNAELWRRWWEDEGEAFEVSELPPEEEVSEVARDSIGVTFFGITTESERVLFVLDLSGSMNFSMVPRNNPTDGDPNNPDMPQEGEVSRLTAAKRAMLKALGGVEDGAIFNLVLYAADVWSWQDELVTMDLESRTAVVEYVDALEAVGGTNIFGAVQQALEMAGAKEGDEWVDPAVDTIFLLTDGRASIGQTTDPDEILAFVRDTNRTAGIVIHTIGLSGAQDAYLLRTMAEQNGGTYVAH